MSGDWRALGSSTNIIPPSDPRTGPNLDGWTLLAGLAEEDDNGAPIGPMVTGVTYRNWRCC